MHILGLPVTLHVVSGQLRSTCLSGHSMDIILLARNDDTSMGPAYLPRLLEHTKSIPAI